MTVAKKSAIFRHSSIDELRQWIDKSIPRWSPEKYDEKLGVFAIESDSGRPRKHSSFSRNAALVNEGLFINGVTTPFDSKKDEEVVKPFLEQAREEMKSTRVLLAKSGMGKTFTWYRMCSYQDSEKENRQPVFVVLLSSLVDNMGFDTSKESHAGTLPDIMKFDSGLSLPKSSDSVVMRKNWYNVFKDMTHLLDCHLAVLRHVRRRIPEVSYQSSDVIGCANTLSI